MRITTIGLDIAKNVFQVHGIDASEKVFVRKQLRALPPCLVGMRLAPRPIIGRVNSRSLVTRYG
jgi:hypothetical protein